MAGIRKANAYIDIGYLVKSTHDSFGLDYALLNVGRLGIQIVKMFGWEHERTFLYDGIGDEEKESEAWKRRRQWLERNELERHTHLRRGRIAAESRTQKRVDVQLTVDVLKDARIGSVDAVVLLAGDDDFTPLVEAVREIGPQVGLVLLPKASYSASLLRAADVVHTIDPGNAHWKDALRDQPFL